MAPGILEVMGVNGFITYYIFLFGFVVGFLLIALSWWHGYLIGLGETSVEHMFNQKDFISMNPNRLENWKRFFGVRTIGQFIRRILFPSTHKPRGNGVTTDDYDINTNLLSCRADSDQTKRHVPYTSDIHHSILGSYPVNQSRFVDPSYQAQSQPSSSNSSYQPRKSSKHIVYDC
jgi:hypothetical protein